MKRREFVALAGGAVVAWPLAARGQQPATPVVGFLDPTSSDAFGNRQRGFLQGLKDTGYVDGENVTILFRFAENQSDRLPHLAAELVRRQVNVIATLATGAMAAKSATTTIPVVSMFGEDPVKLGLVASLASPGGNVTGINFWGAELVAKRLELLREIVPAATRVSVLSNPNGPNAETVRDVQSAARAMGLQIQDLKANTSRGINAAFATFVSERPDALFVDTDPFFHKPACPIGPFGDAAQDPSHIWGASICRGRRAHELWEQHRGCVAPARRLCRSHPQGREDCGLAGRAGVQVRASHQCPDRHDARPHRAARAARSRRRGDRIGDFAAPALWSLMAQSVVPRRRNLGRFRGKSGHRPGRQK